MATETKPRRPIAAMHKGPGPCYALNPVVGYPEHCTSKVRKPAYSFGGRHKQFSDECSPGPKYAIEKGFTRSGPNGAPQIGISGRNKDPTSFMTPSPDKYSVNEANNAVFKTAPACTMASRTKQNKADNTPSANAYTLPTTLGDKCVDKKTCPSYGIRSRPTVGGFSEDLQKTPGPGAYKVSSADNYKRKMPQYSMTGRNELPGDNTQKPGPGAHSVENVTVHKPQAPGYSFGIRHSAYTAPLIVECAD